MMLRRALAPLIGACLSAAFPAPASAADWETISADESRMIVDVPGIHTTPSTIRRRTEGFQRFSEHGVWRSSPDRSVLVELLYQALSPTGNTYFSGGGGDLEEQIRTFWGRNLDSLGEGGRGRNALGHYRFQRFSMTGGIGCVYLVEYDGTKAAEVLDNGEEASGKALIQGRLCKLGVGVLGDDLLRAFAHGIGVRGWASPGPAP